MVSTFVDLSVRISMKSKKLINKKGYTNLKKIVKFQNNNMKISDYLLFVKFNEF